MGNMVSDKRRVRREHKGEFLRVVRELNGAGGLGGAGGAASAARPRRPAPSKAFRASSTRVVVRKRPFFEKEDRAGEFDVVHVPAGGKVAVVRDCRIEADMKKLFLLSRSFEFDQVYDEGTSNAEVFGDVAAPLVDHVLGGGGTHATMFAFGQTGSGKTFTMSAMQHMASERLFSHLREAVEEQSVILSVSCFEMIGTRCFDLLRHHRELHLREDGDGTVHVRGVRRVVCDTAAQLMDAIALAARMRRTDATEVNDTSSRSHSICRIGIWGSEKEYGAGDGSNEPAESFDFRSSAVDSSGAFQPLSELQIIDLAGSERNIDSAHHNAEQRRDGAAINMSLSVLKQCILAKAIESSDKEGKPTRIPYRDSKLTLLLKTLWTDAHAMSAVVATVSPASKDTEHTINTLRHATLMSDPGEEEVDELTGKEGLLGPGVVKTKVPSEEELTVAAFRASEALPIRKWTPKHVSEWATDAFAAVAKDFGRGRRPSGRRPSRGERKSRSPPAGSSSRGASPEEWRIGSSVDGRQLLRWSTDRFVAACGGNALAGAAMHGLLKKHLEEHRRRDTAKREAIRIAVKGPGKPGMKGFMK